MAIKHQCSCGTFLLVKDEQAGKRVRCPRCQTVQSVPGPRPEEAEPLEVELEELPPEPPPARPPRPLKPPLPPPAVQTYPPRRADDDLRLPPVRRSRWEDDRPVDRPERAAGPPGK